MTVLDMPTIEHLADLALSTGAVVVCAGYVVVPDMVLVEQAANGIDAPPTWSGTRPDGRSVHVYALPEEHRA